MKYPAAFTILTFTLAAASASATTTLTSANFDLDSDATWSGGVPSASGDPDGLINADYNFDDLGSGNTGGNFDASGLGVMSITQTAGDGIGDQYNVHSNPGFTFNLNGGSMTSDGGTFILNGTNFSVAGGTLSTLEFRMANAAMTVSSGSLTATLISLRGGTFSQTGGTITSDHGGPVFNRANTNSTLNLTGGNVVAGTGNNNSFIQHTGVFATIGGSFSANLPGAVNLFGGGIHGNNSTINFTSDWTGSLILDSATVWPDIFEAGDVSIDGVELGPDDFETYFQNASGVITLVPVLPIPAKWTGLGGSTWDSATTANFANNDASDPLSNVTFDVATSVINQVIFDDEYEFNGGSAVVGSFAVDVAAGGIPDSVVTFTNDSNAYVVSSSDANGISGTAQVTASGTSAVTLLGTHAYTGATMIEAGTLNLGDGSTDGSIVGSAITNNSALVVNNTGSITHNAAITGSGSFEKQGTGALTLAANYLNTGSVTLTGGELVFQGSPRASSHSIAASTVLEFDSVGGFNNGAGSGTAFTGAGTLRNMSVGEARWGEAKAVFELSSGALIDIQDGTFVGGSHGNIPERAEEWTNNLSNLNVESVATFLGAEANVRVNVLTGGGTIQSGGNPATTGYTEFTFGVDDGSGDFAGMLTDNASFVGNYAKVGAGSQTLSGVNLYTGNTTVEEGVLTLANGGELTMAPGANGESNVITGVVSGTGTVNLDGALYTDITNTDLTNGNSWLLVDATDLTVNYGATMSILLYSDTENVIGNFTEDAGVWTLVDGDNTWTFTESTGILDLVVEEDGFAAWLDLYPGLSDTSPTGDPEEDGIENTLEYVLDGDPEVSDTSILPGLDTSGADFVFTFTRREESPTDTTQTFQYSSDLSFADGGDIPIDTGAPEVSLGTPSGGLQTVTVTIAKSLAVDGKLFGRLNATLNE